MSDQAPLPQAAEDQSQRWLKYGSNTVLVSVVVVLLAGLLIYLAERHDYRRDETQAGLNSLKPQTVNLIRANTQPITITSFYSKAKRTDQTYGTGADNPDEAATVDRQADAVADLLGEYAAQGRDITVETIDPKLNPSKADALIEQVTDKYGGEVAKYKKFADTLNARYDGISKAADAQLAVIKTLPLDQIKTEDLVNTVNLAILSVQDIPKQLKQTEDTYQRYLHQKPPDYKGITDTVSENMTTLSTILGKVVENFRTSKDDKAAPDDVRKYMTDSIPAYQAMRKQADDLVAQVKGLGELKLDTIREALHQDNAILVRGDSGWKVLRYDQVWKNDSRDLRQAANGATIHPRFAGEQMITSAILGLQQKAKAKVCFVRAGGEPLASSGGQFSSLADRLKDYNFDVTDKDVTGQSQMQAMQQQMPMAPEPTDADIDDAVWVCLAASPQQPQNPMMGGPPPSVLPQKLADHIAKGHHLTATGQSQPGGSAFVLAVPKGDDVTAALAPFGVSVRSDAIVCHQAIHTDGATNDDDIVNQASKNPYIFPIDTWGHSDVTDAINGLPGILVRAVPVQTTSMTGVKAQSVVPFPTAPDAPLSWGETDFDSIRAGPTFDKTTDIAGPLYAAAMSERPDGSRLFAVGSPISFEGSDMSLQQSVVDLPDQELLKKGVVAPQFPGDAELFMDATFWLTHQEPMIAISPAAMTVARIAPMSHVSQGFWHVGVLLVGLPGLVLAAGAAAYLSRRD